MSYLYLILHKVRGEPAFDVAQKLQIGDEEGWIIPTSGHRAYPYKHWPLTDLACVNVVDQVYDNPDTEWIHAFDLPGDWPDHYATAHAPEDRKAKGKIDMTKLLSAIVPKMKRRF